MREPDISHCQLIPCCAECTKFSPLVFTSITLPVFFGFSSDGQRGVDSTESADIALTHAKVLAKECNCVVVVTGKDDHVTDGSRVITVSNGHPILQKITACGCSLTSMIAAFVSVVDWTSKEQVMKSCAHALCVFGIAGELAAEKSIVQGVVCPGSARVHLMDALSYMNCEHVQQMAKFP